MNVSTLEFSNINKIDRRYYNIYERLQKLVTNYYQGELVYKAFSQAPTKREMAVIGLLTKNNPLEITGKILFPVIVDEQMAGFCEVKIERKLTKTETQRLSHLIDMLVVHCIKSSRHLLKIRSQERIYSYNMNPSTETTEENNVVYLSTLSNQRKSVAIPPQYQLGKDRRALKINLPTLIESRFPEESFKLARELHDHSDRFAFLSLHDLDLAQLETSGLNSLGPVTIYIPELAKLLEREQKLILKFFRNEERNAESPVIIGTSKYPKMILEESKTINPEILLRLSTLHIEMTEPFNHYKKQGLLDFIITTMSKSRRV